MNLPRWIGSAASLLFTCLATGALGAAEVPLSWNAEHGVVWRTVHATVNVDQAGGPPGPLFRFGTNRTAQPLENVKLTQATGRSLTLSGEVTAPGGRKLGVHRALTATSGHAGEELSERLEIVGGQGLGMDLEVVRPFTIQADLPPSAGVCALPLKHGEFRQGGLDEACVAEYRLGHWPAEKTQPAELALPVLGLGKVGAWQAAVCADPYYSVRFQAVSAAAGITGQCRYQYWSSKVALEKLEKRTFGFWIAPPPQAEPKLRGPIDAFFRLALPDVPPGPAWLKDVYAVYYDYMNNRGRGWDMDIDFMTRTFGPANTKHIAVCYHGWYDRIGAYCFDPKTKTLKEAWESNPLPNVRFPVTKQQMRRQLALAKSKGFRTFLYFGDGLCDDTAQPGYREDWKWVSPEGKVLAGWPAPMFGKLYARNPAHPEVLQWHKDYLAALIREFGPMIDGFVWDETFFIGTGAIAVRPEPSYSDRAMIRLVRDLTAQVEAWDPQKVFLNSDNVGGTGTWGNKHPHGVPGYAMVADGDWQDSACVLQMWPYCLFPNWRNTYWSCHWFTFSHYQAMQAGMRLYGTPVSFSAGYGDMRAPHDWTAEESARFVRDFQERKAAGRGQVHYLTVPWQAYGPMQWNTNPPPVFPENHAAKAQRW